MHFFNSGSPSGLPTLSVFLLSNLLGTTSGAALQPRAAVPAPYVAASYYPAPHGGWADDWADAYEKAVKLVSQMTLAEKTNITGGTGFFMGNFLPCRPLSPLLLLTGNQGLAWETLAVPTA